jgi:hypothetical protein
VTKTIRINRAPVLTLWAAVVAERLGHSPDEALTLGKAVAGLNAQSKGRHLGIFHEVKKSAGERTRPRKPAGNAVAIELLGRQVPAVNTPDGVRAPVKGVRVTPASVERYLESKFGEALPAVRAAMEALAKALTRRTLETEAFSVYEKFRPTIPEGKRGWGAAGELDLSVIRSLARAAS